MRKPSGSVSQPAPLSVSPLSVSLWLVFIGLLVIALPGYPALPFSDTKNGVPTLAPVLQDVTPAVVNISVVTRSAIEENPLFRDPFFRRFFNLPEQEARPERSVGSGVIMDAAKGYVVTNYHVIKDAQQVVVTLKDRRQFQAKLVGTDPGTDIALLKIDAKNLKALRLGDSDLLNVGDFVIAIGNPFGLGQTVTSGIVSALGRSGLDIEGYEDFIQTDASINPGNSGGALINLKGELIGINTAIIGPAGGNVGIGFAVPSVMVKAVLDQILRFGEVRRGRLGASSEDITHDLAASLGLPSTEGAIISAVEPGSPAEKAGVKPRDVITTVNGKPVRNSIDLRNKVGLMPIGETLDLGLIRNGKRLTAKVKIAKLAEASSAGAEAVPEVSGATVADLKPGARRGIEGVMVTDVEVNSPAWLRGIRPGDLIIGVNRRQVRSVQELLAALKASSQGRLTLSLIRGDFRVTIRIR
ncbi:serine protease Do/serine protease DegQ [Nitrosospira multiformis ATCC 25196]|uniref:Peptidase S1C, Do n=1 Tax=Nitrosospira multiformis (strain ATCC 25196 / NCIMB 11849 / C 71) TaxID=323848 RepID=Q2YBQ3_NITMU|nr:DegQ family serine endoprotease [Nitrosospira multiformis]ABB73818.1 Peptidase S1C, Do [Nitrosospira multiformis ATCC 25196]SEF42663.1 serine protease Do/serine protease DegQ [Nitrosospira multiformis ATCC 25196]